MLSEIILLAAGNCMHLFWSVCFSQKSDLESGKFIYV